MMQHAIMAGIGYFVGSIVTFLLIAFGFEFGGKK